MPARVVHPIKATRGTGYGPRINPVTGQREFHRGNDYSVPRKTPIYAPTDGTVVEGKDRRADTVDGFGNWIWIDAQRTVGKDFIFGHLEHGDILVRRGDRVTAGDLIGYVGSAGQSTGPHLHFEVWGSPGVIGGEHMDPAAWLKRAGAVDPGTTAVPATTTSAASVPSTTKGATVATAQDVQNELTGGTGVDPATVELFFARPAEFGGGEVTASLRKAVFRAAWEITHYIRKRGLTQLKDQWTRPDTLLGNAVEANSWGRVNHELLLAVAAKVGMSQAEIDAALAPVSGNP